MRLRAVVVGIALVATSLTLGTPSSAHDGGPSPEKIQAFQEVLDRGPAPRAPQGFAPCIRGMAAKTYPCDRIDMLSHMTLEDLGLSFGNDMWGWTDPLTRRDYALMGGIEGTVVVDITNPVRPRHVGTLPAHVLDPARQFWRDIKVFANHMFVGSEATDHGIQVLDLTEVRGLWGGPVTFTETAHYAGVGSSHNVNINEETGFLYVLGARNVDSPNGGCAGGLHMVDINDPADPTFAGCFAAHGYIHDTQCVVYRGPDTEHQGKEVCFNSNAVGAYGSADHFVSIVDVSDKANPIGLGRQNYADSGYSHQGWLTPDQTHFLHGDEGDEFTHGLGTTTRVWDVTDLDDPVMVLQFANDTASIDHNVYTEGKVAYASNYTSGLRVYDTRGVSTPALAEKAFFDVYPENDDASFEGGTWSNYPYFRNKNIVAVSSIDRGLFILRPRGR